MMNKLSALLLMALLNIHFINAQNIYKDGYVINTSKDTLSGFILEEIDSDAAQNISFMDQDSETKISEYTPNDLLGFGYNYGRNFGRVKIKAPENSEHDSIYVFAKRIVKGKIDLYVVTDSSGNSMQFYLENNETKESALLLEPKTFERTINDKTYAGSDLRYQYQLNRIKYGNLIKNRVNKNLKYRQKSIRKDIYNYNVPFDAEYPVEKYKEAVKHNFDVLGGIALNADQNDLQLRAAVFYSKEHKENPERLSHLISIMYRYSQSNQPWENQYPRGSFDYQAQNIAILPVGLKYQAKSGKIRPYAYAGFGIDFTINTDYVIEDYEIRGTSTSSYSWLTLKSGIGAKIKTGSHFIITEIAPSWDHIFFSIGYSL